MASKKTKKVKAKKTAAKKTVRKLKKVVRPAKKNTAKAKSVKSLPVKGQPKAPAQEVVAGVLLGEVEDYFSKVGVIAFTLKAPLAVGEMIRIKGHTTDITQKVESMQIEHQPIQTASPGDSVGIKIADRSRKGDLVYKV